MAGASAAAGAIMGPLAPLSFLLGGGPGPAGGYLDYFRQMVNGLRQQQGLEPIDFSKDPNAAATAGAEATATATEGQATGISAGQPASASTDIAGRSIPSSAILPGVVPTMNPDLTKAWNDFLSKNVGKGVTPFPGQLSPDVNKTLLPQAYQAAAGMTQTDPTLAKMMLYGGTGGPGNFGMANAMNFGTPSMVGQWLHNVADTGVSSPGAGGALQALAAGSLNGPAQFLAPFLLGGGGRNTYQAPMMPIRDVSIGGR